MNTPRWNEITAVFGGRFDPPHLGHREAVAGLFRNPGIKQAVILPSAQPPHKPALASTEDRVQMARLGFACTGDYPKEVIFDLSEIERAKKNPGIPSYTYDSLLEIRPVYGPLAFVLGTDQLVQFHTWYRFPEILTLAHWIVLDRKSAPSRSARETLTSWASSGLIRATSQELCWKLSGGSTFIQWVSTDAQPISSTLVREEIGRTGHPPQNVLLPSVFGYLKEKQLYGSFK